MKICKIENCIQKYYAKEFCKKHYAAFIEREGYKLHKCKVEQCLRYTHKTYCGIHKYRALHKLPIAFKGNCNTFRTKAKNNMWME